MKGIGLGETKMSEREKHLDGFGFRFIDAIRALRRIQALGAFACDQVKVVSLEKRDDGRVVKFIAKV